MTPIESDTPLNYVTCEGCGEMTNQWFTCEDSDGGEYETAVCSPCQQAWIRAEEEAEAAFDATMY